MLTQRSQVRKWFIESKMKAYIQRKIGWSDPGSGSRIKRGGALPAKYSEYFGAKRRGLLKVKVFWRQKARFIYEMKISGMIHHLLSQASVVVKLFINLGFFTE